MLLDTSHTAEGYVAAAATSDAKAQIPGEHGESKYNYDRPTEPGGLPAAALGDGEYTFEVWRQNPNGKYARLYGPAPKPWRWPASSSLCAPQPAGKLRPGFGL